MGKKARAAQRKANRAWTGNKLRTMVGGEHYLGYEIQPLDYIMSNQLGFVEGCVIKYVTRWPRKGGIEDLEKARDVLDKYIARYKRGHGEGGNSR